MLHAVVETTFDVSEGVVLRLLVAAVLGAMIGTEREATDQPAGVRTHIAVAVGACLFGIISTVGLLEYADDPGERVRVDVSRVASNVVVGIGFLGAGVIFRRGSTIRNLTTAASLWAVAAIGLACGTGDLGTAALTTGLLLFSLVLLRPFRAFVHDRLARSTVSIRAELTEGSDPGELIEAMGAIEGVEVTDLRVGKERGQYVVFADARSRPDAVREWLNIVATRTDVETLAEA